MLCNTAATPPSHRKEFLCIQALWESPRKINGSGLYVYTVQISTPQEDSWFVPITLNRSFSKGKCTSKAIGYYLDLCPLFGKKTLDAWSRQVRISMFPHFYYGNEILSTNNSKWIYLFLKKGLKIIWFHIIRKVKQRNDGRGQCTCTINPRRQFGKQVKKNTHSVVFVMLRLFTVQRV